MLILPRPRVLVLLTSLTLFGASCLSLDLPTAELFSTNMVPFLAPRNPQVLLVSASYPLPNPMHTHEEYTDWMTPFLSKVTTHIYFFAPPEMEGTIRKLRGNLPMTLNTTFSAPFDIPPLRGMEGRYADMHKLDPEKAYHSPERYAGWSSKIFFLREALLNAQSTGMDVGYVFWNDAGSFREQQDFTDWPALERVDEIFAEGAKLSGMHKDELFFMPMWDVPYDDLRDWTPLEGPRELGDSIAEDSFFGGPPNAIHWWHKTYWAYHDYYIFKSNKFAGKHRIVFNGLFMLYPQRFITVWQYDREHDDFKNLPKAPLGECGEPWWYHQFFVASNSDREHMRTIWTPSYRRSPEFPDSPPAINGEESNVCRMTRTLWMDDVMRRRWGSDWKPPRTPVDIDISQRD